MLLFLARIFGSHAGITKPARHTLTQCGFVGFGSIAPQQNGCMGAYRVIDLEQFPVRISTDKAPTPLTKSGICSFFFFFFCHSPFFLSFFLCLYRLARFMAFQSVLVGTTPAFTIIINSTKRSLLGQYIVLLWSNLTALCNILRRFLRRFQC